MSETKKTLILGAVAVVLAIIAILVRPARITPEAFLDQGEPFFPDFTDPNDATTLEVIDYDEATGSARPFKVTFTQGRWTIPSHHNYPADARDRLAKTAAGVIDIKKDDFRTDNVADHEACGVVDPLDESAAGLSGRGKRVTLKEQGGALLADVIIGKNILSRPGFRFVRVPQQNRVYAARVDADISTRFEDWIDSDLLQTDADRIRRLVRRDYSINERTLSIEQGDNLILTLQNETWTADRMSASQQVDSSKMKELLTALDELSIVGVRPKPGGLSASLRGSSGETTVSQADQLSLQQKGFYLSRDGQLLSNEGEMQVSTTDGITYTLRFGEVLYGSGLAVTAGAEAEKGDESGTEENRYLFITARFDLDYFGPQPAGPANDEFRTKPDSLLSVKDRQNKERQEALDQWQNKVDQGTRLAETLNARFADWYYVISGMSFEKLNQSRSSLVVSK
ncbi:MAG TPA: DUF4340 domain-containing protein [Acidobacteriota bacterium]|nr:DUF4340 domain-containing protein [Acidobacteriota bacterium]